MSNLLAMQILKGHSHWSHSLFAPAHWHHHDLHRQQWWSGSWPCNFRILSSSCSMLRLFPESSHRFLLMTWEHKVREIAIEHWYSLAVITSCTIGTRFHMLTEPSKAFRLHASPQFMPNGGSKTVANGRVMKCAYQDSPWCAISSEEPIAPSANGAILLQSRRPPDKHQDAKLSWAWGRKITWHVFHQHH